MAAAADEKEKKSTAREYYEALLIAIIFVNFARIFVFQAFKIPTGSMEDNLKIGDHIIVNKFIYGPASDAWSKLVPLRDMRGVDLREAVEAGHFRLPTKVELERLKRDAPAHDAIIVAWFEASSAKLDASLAQPLAALVDLPAKPASPLASSGATP